MQKIKKPRKWIKFLFIFIIIIVMIFLYARYLNPYMFKINEIAIINKNLDSSYNGLKIVQFSDLHYGRTTDEEKLKKVIEEINNLKADIVIFTGDLMDELDINEDELEIIIKELKAIECKLFKFAVIGDYDQKYLNIYKDIMEKSNFYLLDNSSKLVYNNTTTPLNFIGLTNTDKIEELYNNEYFNITLMHKPDLIKEIDNTELAFAGHSLGGQFRIPFIGGIKKIAGAETYIDTYYKIDNTKLYISNGIGTQDISMRLFNTPSITLYRLYNY